MTQVLLREGCEVHFVGWERVRGEVTSFAWRAAGVEERVALKGGGYSSVTARLMYPLWMLIVFCTVLFRHRGEGILLCLGWETAFPARLATIGADAQIVFDDADRFSMLINFPAPMRKIIEKCEVWTSRSVHRHLVPSFSRYTWKGSNMVSLPNTPLQEDLRGARQRTPGKLTNGFTVYVNGWLGGTRGIDVIEQILDDERLRIANVRFVMAGRVDSENGQRVIEHPRVTYLGEVDQETALSLYHTVDIALTYYDPAVRINRLAEANKWGDCVHFQTPFIVNEEVVTAEKFSKSGAAWACPYWDLEGLVHLLTRLAQDPQEVETAARSIAAHRESFPPFDVGWGAVVRDILRGGKARSQVSDT